MSRLTGKTALVTGASRGIAKNLGAEGAAVVVNYATSREGAASSTFTAPSLNRCKIAGSLLEESISPYMSASVQEF